MNINNNCVEMYDLYYNLLFVEKWILMYLFFEREYYEIKEWIKLLNFNLFIKLFIS